MKRFFLYMTAALCLISCNNKDSMWLNAVTDLDSRVTTLEELCAQMNTNITSLQTIVKAFQDRDYVTNAAEIKEGEDVIGYTITFAKNPSITIYKGNDGKDGVDGKDGKDGVDGKDGKDGVDGITPVIGAAIDTDSIYYWTLNGTWLLDAQGNKIRVTGEDGQDGKDGEDGADGQNGKDGVSPKLKIESDYWYISYDNGTTWTKLGKAKGEDGQDGEDGEDGDSMFKSVTQDENYVYFTLADGSVIKISKNSSIEQTIIDNLVNSISLDHDTIYMIVGDSIVVTSTTLPFPNSKVSWLSTNQNVASVNDGLVNAIHSGVTRIEATAGTKRATCIIFVKTSNKKKFSIGNNKQVEFALGNLVGSEGLYSFDDYFAKGSNFWWGETRGLTEDGVYFQNYTMNQYTYDWGIHPIINQGNYPNEWRTLDSTEWKYVLNKRPNAQKLKLKVQDAWILLPDGEDDPSFFLLANCFSMNIWKRLIQYCEIPYFYACGMETYYQTMTPTITSGTYYWSSDAVYKDYQSSTQGCCINFDTGEIMWPFVSSSAIRHYKVPVRLVKDVK